VSKDAVAISEVAFCRRQGLECIIQIIVHLDAFKHVHNLPPVCSNVLYGGCSCRTRNSRHGLNTREPLRHTALDYVVPVFSRANANHCPHDLKTGNTDLENNAVKTVRNSEDGVRPPAEDEERKPLFSYEIKSFWQLLLRIHFYQIAGRGTEAERGQGSKGDILSNGHSTYDIPVAMARTSEQEKIGFLIKKLREEKGMTQKAFAKELGTSQSAVARIENGHQNLTLNELGKISKVLERKILGLNESIDFRVTGGRKLRGSITMNGSKNGAVNMICASLLNRGKTILHDIPRIEEVYRYIELVESMGASVRWTGTDTIEIQPPKELNFSNINGDVAARTRSFTFIGALIHWGKSFRLPHSGGCKMGERTISAHRHGLEKFGVRIKTRESHYEITAGKLRPAEFVLYESSDTGAINVLLAAAKIPGVSIIKFAPPNYQVQDVCFLLEKMGVRIEGIGTTTLTVHGVAEIDQTIEHYNSEDPIEAMFFIAAAAVTESKVCIKRVSVNFLLLELEKLRIMGLGFEMGDKYLSRNGRTELVDLTILPSKLRAPSDKLHAQPFPGLNIDNLPFFAVIATQAEGQTLIHDWVYENRAIYFTELNRLGAKVTLLDPHRALIEGPSRLKGAQIVCPPALRPSAVILIAMLAAEGVSTLRNVYSIRRGYAEIAERLNKLGAKVEVIRSM